MSTDSTAHAAALAVVSIATQTRDKVVRIATTIPHEDILYHLGALDNHTDSVIIDSTKVIFVEDSADEFGIVFSTWRIEPSVFRPKSVRVAKNNIMRASILFTGLVLSTIIFAFIAFIGVSTGFAQLVFGTLMFLSFGSLFAVAVRITYLQQFVNDMETCAVEIRQLSHMNMSANIDDTETLNSIL